jgi:hypothetical protein
MRTLQSSEEDALSALLSLQAPVHPSVASAARREDATAAAAETKPAAVPREAAPEAPGAIKWERVSDDTPSAEIPSGTHDQPSWDGSEHAFEECGSEDSSASELDEGRKRDADALSDQPSKRVRGPRDGEAATTVADKLKVRAIDRVQYTGLCVGTDQL